MPTYEFECDKCGHRFEIMQGVNDPSPKKCPDCGKQALRKVFHPVGIIYKGSGFYATDYASKDRKAKAAAEAGGDKTADADRGDTGPTGDRGEKAVGSAESADKPASSGDSSGKQEATADKAEPEKKGAEASTAKQTTPERPARPSQDSRK